MSYILFGIPNCDTVKKARTWLSENGIDFEFHNYKKEGITENQIKMWLKQVPLKLVMNKASSTFRKLTDDQKEQADDPDLAIDLMVENPSMIKRPVLMRDDDVIAVGFKPDQYKSLF